MVGMLKNNLDSIRLKLESEKGSVHSVDSPCVIAVSKKQPVEKINELYSLGVKNFAENYLQEAAEKIEKCKSLEIDWHFIGKLQTKKIREIVKYFSWIHTVSRSVEAEKISIAANELAKTINILVQVNIAEEDSKQGIGVAELLPFLENLNSLSHVSLRGLMIFPPLSQNESESLLWFKQAKELFENVRPNFGPNFNCLSMGTSTDYHLAFRQGATHLRIGEALMGARS